jgi:hypothetical protein
MEDQNDGVVGGERRKDTFWLVMALGLAVLLEGIVLVLDLTAVLK